MAFFGATLVLTSLLLIGMTEHQSQSNLLEDSKQRMSGKFFRRLEEDRLHLLKLLASRIVDNPSVNQYRAFLSAHGYLGKMEAHYGFASSLKLLREAKRGQQAWLKPDFDPKAHEDDLDGACYRCWTALSGLSRDLGPSFFEESENALDLLILTDSSSRPVIELRSGPNGQPPDAEAPLIEPKISTDLQAALLQMSDDQSVLTGHLLHTDGDLYLIRGSPFASGGAVLVGTRLDRRWLLHFEERITLFKTRLVVNHRLITPETGPDPMGEALLHVPTGDAALLTLNKNDYLVASTVLHTGFQKDEGAPVACVYYVRPMSSVKDELRRMTRGIVALGLGALLIALGGTYILSNQISRQLELLANRMVGVGEGDLNPFVFRATSYEIDTAGTAFNSMVGQLRQKAMLAKMVPKKARQAIELEQSEGGRLQGQRLKTTVLFSDIRGFTSMSERLTPTQVMRILDVYLSKMTEVIEANQGDVNEYIGDAILADFEDLPGHPGGERAVRAARSMRAALEELHQQADELKELRQGIGIHTGEVVKGEIGALDRSKFALIGDTVNLAARIQDRSRDGRHSCILVSDSTYHEACTAFAFASFGEQTFKGKEKPVLVWEVVEPFAV
jgi:class 3 adenylate cyclase